MKTGTIIMMVLILGGMWGSFALALSMAYKKEAAKRSQQDEDMEN